MLKKIFFIHLIFIITSAQSQIFPAKFRIHFTDKNNSPYSLKNPTAYLSQKALERRNKQNISIIENDIPVNPFYLDSIKNAGGIILNNSRWFNSAIILVNDSFSFKKILSFPFICKADTLVVKFTKTKNTTRFSNQKRVLKFYSPDLFSANIKSMFDYGAAYNQINMLGGIDLHRAGFRGNQMTITILDAGFAKVNELNAFDSLWSNNRILGTKNFVEPNENVYSSSTHGMYVLSLMCANIHGLMIGTAPEASFWLLKTEDVATENVIEEDNWVAGAEFADSVGTDIISSSLGYTVFDDTLQNHSYKQMNGYTSLASIGARIAASKGILVVNSAGNAALKPFKYIGAPADADSILSVGAVDNNGTYAQFSSIGPSSDGRIKPEIAAQGVSDAIITISDSVAFGNGTSFACPIISGLAACLWQSSPMLTNMQLREAIIKSADKYFYPDEFTGYGIPNFNVAYLNLHLDKIKNAQNVFPNPFRDKLNIIFYSKEDLQIANIEINTIYNKKIFSFNKQCIKGYNSFILNDSTIQLKKGIYILKIKTANEELNIKIIKM